MATSKTRKSSLNPQIVFVDPNVVERCTPASPQTDLNQFDGNRDHPHAFFNRGYFIESKRTGQILGGDWDVRPSPRFDELLECVAIREHISGETPWIESDFCNRCVRAIESGYQSRGHINPDEFVKSRVEQIEKLIASVSEFGVYPSEDVFDNISVNISSSGEYLFNNRGHHRLSVARSLGMSSVPVLVVITHEKFSCLDRIF